MSQLSDPHVELLDDAMHASAVSDRAQRRRIGDADALDATFVGSLRAVAEQGVSVLLELSVGRSVRGRITGVAAEHVVLDGPFGTGWVRIDAIVSLRGQPGAQLRAASGAATPTGDGLLAALEELVVDRSPIEVSLTGGEVVRGAAVGAGRDVLSVQLDSSRDVVLVQLRHAVLVVCRPA